MRGRIQIRASGPRVAPTTTLPLVDGKYLAEARRQMLMAEEEGVSRNEHLLRSLASLAEAHAELEARVTTVETGPAWRGDFGKPQDS